jgi:hypothetical protein
MISLRKTFVFSESRHVSFAVEASGSTAEQFSSLAHLLPGPGLSGLSILFD